MALNIKDQETEELVAKVAELVGASKTGAVREGMRRWYRDLVREQASGHGPGSLRHLREELHDLIPETFRTTPLTKADREEILGYGPEGV